MDTKRTAKLTREQQEFFGMMRLRSISMKHGQPAIRHQIFSLVPISAPGHGTTSVDKHSRVYIDFDLMMELGVEVATKYLIHEAWHVLRDHHARGKKVSGKQFKAWNVAADCEINDDIKDVPANFYLPKTIGCSDFKMAELYFETTKNTISEDSEVGMECGSGAGNEDGDELDDDEAPARSEVEQDVARMLTADAIIRDGSKAGDGSVSSMLEWARRVKKGKQTPWQQILRNTIVRAVDFKAGEDEFDWGFRSRLADAVPEAVFPGEATPHIRVAVAIDTSGSNQDNLGKAVREIDQIMRKVGIKGSDLMVFSVDSEATDPQFVNDIKAIKLHGGGGTDMRVGIDVMTKLKGERKVDIGIVITDGETPWPKEKPRGDTVFIACITPNRWNHRDLESTMKTIPSWMKSVLVSDEI